MTENIVPTGRVTLPIETGMDTKLQKILAKLGADAVRNSDGTHLPAAVSELAAKVYATYFVARGDQEWALAHPETRTRLYLLSASVTAPLLTPATSTSPQPLTIRLLEGYFTQQVSPDLESDPAQWWEVIDRTTGEVLAPANWEVVSDPADPAATAVVITSPQPHHDYTVSFLAWQNWDSTQMYNYLTNNWETDPSRVREQPYDVAHPAAWAHMKESLKNWLTAHPEVDVVRFTTFFYHFTLVFNDQAKEKYVDWFGYSASVSPRAIEAFAAEYGYRPRPEDFVDEGYYNSPFRPPRQAFTDWMAFQHRFVTARISELTELVHAAGKEAMMFLGDNWIGTEPYGPHFADTGLDAVVGSVGSATTCRLISDIPALKYTEGRFLPYFFPDVFTPGGDPLGEANTCWLTARRAIVRSPLDRIGYGGYLSLALEFPEFVERIAEICDEFRLLHERSASQRPANSPLVVGVLTAWGELRSWQSHLVAHALWYRQSYSYLGVLEALAGLPFAVKFIDFAQAKTGALAEIDVLINAGAADTAYSGGPAWADPELQVAVKQFVAAGGGIIGVGEPSAYSMGGKYFQLAAVFGLDKERGWSQSTDKYWETSGPHFLTADLPGPLDIGQSVGEIFALPTRGAQVLRAEAGSVDLATHTYGTGRSVYFAGLPYSSENSRTLHRAIYWAAGCEAAFEADWTAANPNIEVALYPQTGQLLVYNNSAAPIQTQIRGNNGGIYTAVGKKTRAGTAGPNPTVALRHLPVSLPPGGYAWLQLPQ